jgi:hypothetical protein
LLLFELVGRITGSVAMAVFSKLPWQWVFFPVLLSTGLVHLACMVPGSGAGHAPQEKPTDSVQAIVATATEAFRFILDNPLIRIALLALTGRASQNSWSKWLISDSSITDCTTPP